IWITPSCRRMPASMPLILLDSGIRRNDEKKSAVPYQYHLCVLRISAFSAFRGSEPDNRTRRTVFD
ncbi:MAG: hypothetical protein LC646_09285, partial [Xanthomonadaceae bacterium]|nr:hypothetical protein [Xanthomonadaceae bacterium]